MVIICLFYIVTTTISSSSNNHALCFAFSSQGFLFIRLHPSLTYSCAMKVVSAATVQNQ